MNDLLTREEFSYEVIERDHFKCVICGTERNLTAHHIIDRSLFADSEYSYQLDNGVTLCPEHHLQAERTQISCKELRKLAGILDIVLPEHLDTEEEWDHWGNIVLHSGARLRGEKFYQENVQKALKEGDVLASFLPYVKYPRTYHLPSSPNLQNDDRKHTNVDKLMSLPIIASIKEDGENTTLYPDYIHARSIDSKHHESRAWVKSLHGRIKRELPEGYRICGENLYAKHSIHYKHLRDYFYVFSIWNEKNEALSWSDTVGYCDILGLQTVPVICKGGGFTLEQIHEEYESYCANSPDPVEGYVIRYDGVIPYHMFKTLTAKYVRENHVQTSKFWMKEIVVPNILESGPIYTESEMYVLRSLLLCYEEYSPDTLFLISNLFQDLPDCCMDSVLFKYRLQKYIDSDREYLSRDQRWSNAAVSKELKTREELYKAMFCPFNEVPMSMGGQFPHICKWRLENGK